MVICVFLLSRQMRILLWVECEDYDAAIVQIHFWLDDDLAWLPSYCWGAPFCYPPSFFGFEAQEVWLHENICSSFNRSSCDRRYNSRSLASYLPSSCNRLAHVSRSISHIWNVACMLLQCYFGWFELFKFNVKVEKELEVCQRVVGKSRWSDNFVQSSVMLRSHVARLIGVDQFGLRKPFVN